MTFFLGCNNVIPTTNTDGTVTDTVTAATLAADGSQVPLPTGAISSAEILIDVQGTADVSNITVNGQVRDAAPGTRRRICSVQEGRVEDVALAEAHGEAEASTRLVDAPQGEPRRRKRRGSYFGGSERANAALRATQSASPCRP
jgi:hypothetical protein